MLKFICLLIVALMLQVSRAWDESNSEEEQLAAARQQSDEYFANAYGYTPNPWDSSYYQPNSQGKYSKKIQNVSVKYLRKEILYNPSNICLYTFLPIVFLEYFSSLQSQSPFTRTNVYPFDKYFVTSEYIFVFFS
jgi:hypothetical protein